MNSQNFKDDTRSAHKIVIDCRKRIDITGVRDVLSFDETEVTLHTTAGELIIEGKELSVTTLDTDRGVVIVDGRIDSLYYSTTDEKKSRGLFGRMIK